MFRYLNNIPHHVFLQHSLQYKLGLYFTGTYFTSTGGVLDLGINTDIQYPPYYQYSVLACGQFNKCLFLFPVVQEKRSKVVCSFSELGVDPWKRSTAAIVAIELLSQPHRTFLYSVALDNNNRSMAYFFPIFTALKQGKEYLFRMRLRFRVCAHAWICAPPVFCYLFPTSHDFSQAPFVFGVPQKLVRLRGDAHCQLRDGGRGGDVHQARLPALHLGPVSSSGVSIALPICFFSSFATSEGWSASGATPTVSFPSLQQTSKSSFHPCSPPFFFLPLTLIPQNSSLFLYPGESRCRIVFGYV